MKAEEIVRQWLMGHSKQYIVAQEKQSVMANAKTKEEKKNADWQAHHNVEAVLIDWWKKQGEHK